MPNSEKKNDVTAKNQPCDATINIRKPTSDVYEVEGTVLYVFHNYYKLQGSTASDKSYCGGYVPVRMELAFSGTDHNLYKII